MTDTSIRRLTVAEMARAAAQRFVQTGEKQPNPLAGTVDEQAFLSAFNRWVREVQAAEGSEGSA